LLFQDSGLRERADGGPDAICRSVDDGEAMLIDSQRSPVFG
jgi:hypothetical protein